MPQPKPPKGIYKGSFKGIYKVLEFRVYIGFRVYIEFKGVEFRVYIGFRVYIYIGFWGLGFTLRLPKGVMGFLEEALGFGGYGLGSHYEGPGVLG